MKHLKHISTPRKAEDDEGLMEKIQGLLNDLLFWKE